MVLHTLPQFHSSHFVLLQAWLRLLNGLGETSTLVKAATIRWGPPGP